MQKGLKNAALLTFFILIAVNVFAQNPLILDQYTADPTARVFEGRLYVYPSHDIPCEEGQGFVGFCMPDYHVFSSENLTDWEDHGVILTHNTIPWVEHESYKMWAPDCVFKNGKYYYYFPASSIEKINGRGRRIGVAIADKPYGPFLPEANFIEGVGGIDPNVFTDKDGTSYMYWAENRVIYGAQLAENMLELATVPVPMKIKGIVKHKFIEGPFMFQRDGKYYMTFPYIPETIEQIVYAMGDSPLGPFEYQNVIMKESPNKCYTNHQSIVQYKNQWYLFYHHNDLSPDSDKRRSIKADSLFFNENGTIQEIVPTLRGVGVSDAGNTINLDRYSAISKEGVSVDYNDITQPFEGWKASFDKSGAWLRYNAVGFSSKKMKSIKVKAKAPAGGSFEIRLNAIDGPLVAKVHVTASEDWQKTTSKIRKTEAGVYNLFVVSTSDDLLEIDWLRFEP